jgi:protein O-GlcNAc transferase
VHRTRGIVPALVKSPKTSTELLERALAHQRAGRVKEAESAYRQLISRNPRHQQALFYLSVLFLESGRFEEASRYLERLLATEPHEPVALTNLGEAYRRQGKLDLAAAAFERILEMDPDFPEARQNLGITLMDGGKPKEALPHLERAVALRPDNARFHVSLAWVLAALGRTEDSLAHARRAVELAPGHAPGHVQLANAENDLGDRAGAIASYRRALELDPSDYRAHSNLILVALTDPTWDSAMLHAEARAWAKLHAEPLRQHIEPPTNDRNPDRRLRIGYVSPDFRAHPVRQFLMPLFRHHDPSTVEVFLYSSVMRPDFSTAEYQELAGERFRDISRTGDLAVAELVRRDRIDVLVDLAVHGAGHRLRVFAIKPAPVQLTWIGYNGTTGLDTVDYRITDPYFDPPGTEPSDYSEQSLVLPESYWCYDALEQDLPVAPLPALAAGHVTFGCLNSNRKVHAGSLALWGRVLAKVPDSRLALIAAENPRIRREMEAAGIDPSRIDFGARVSRREYLERYHRIDLALDTFPFCGGTTTLDAAYMGVPVVTLAGRTTLQRAGSSIANNLGLPELVTTTEDAFVAKAVELARDPERLSMLRAALRPKLEASPFGDHARFARNLEAAYRMAWQTWCKSA